MIQKIKNFILSHKIISIIVLIGIIVGAYFIIKNKSNTETRYVTETVKKGNITTTVTGTGQVEASDTIDIKPKTTDDITYVGVKAGQEVKKGTLLATVDSRDAKVALENARISLAKLTKDPDKLTLLQKQNSVTESYDNGWNTTSSYITDMTSMIIDLGDLYNNDGYLGYKNISNLGSTGKTKVSLAEDSFYDAQRSVEELTKLYKTLSRSSSQAEIDNLLNKSYESSKIVANAVKNAEAAFNYTVEDLSYENNSNTTTTRTDITSWLSSSNGYVKDLLSAVNAIKEGKQALADTIAGEDELDIKSAQLSVQSKLDAYNDCFVYAPFDGIIATFTAKVGEASGSSIGTIITKQKVATISLNEVDIASVKLGQKATMTFDAVDDLSIPGTVVEMDSVGTVSSGVVTYNVKIAFDQDDERVKAGMSTNIEIITESKQNILTVSSSTVKTKNGVSYVEMFETALANSNSSSGTVSSSLPYKQEIEIGISDDTLTEIVSGLSEGDQIILKTTAGTSSSSSSSSKSIMSGGPMGGSAMGAIR